VQVPSFLQTEVWHSHCFRSASILRQRILIGDMLTNNARVSTDIVRNCGRCGDEFRIGQNERVCQACRKPKKPEQLLRHLTLREKQIIDLVSQAKLNKEIAYQLHLSEGTIKEYLNKVFRKLGVKNRTELAVWSLMHPSECRVTTGRLPGVH
jgi:DNA-binding CsgD family transcriptional regulator